MEKLPRGIKIVNNKDELLVIFNWFRMHILKKLVILSFCLLWYRMAFRFFPEEGAHIYTLLKFIAFFCIPAAVLTYLSLAIFLNKTVIKTTRGGLLITQYPFPWKIITDITLSEGKNFCYKKKNIDKKNYAYSLEVEKEKGKFYSFFQTVNEKESEFIKKEFENFLNIKIPIKSA